MNDDGIHPFTLLTEGRSADSSMDDDVIHLNGGWWSVAHPLILLFRVDEF